MVGPSPHPRPPSSRGPIEVFPPPPQWKEEARDGCPRLQELFFCLPFNCLFGVSFNSSMVEHTPPYFPGAAPSPAAR